MNYFIFIYIDLKLFLFFSRREHTIIFTIRNILYTVFNMRAESYALTLFRPHQWSVRVTAVMGRVSSVYNSECYYC